LDAEGHAHLADFNVASYLQPHRKLTGKSGTAAYMGISFLIPLIVAPEVYSGVGYETSPDWFSLGITFYECIYGRLPFEGEKGESLSRQIQFSEPPFPQTSPPVNNLCILAIRGLLERDPARRLGASSWISLVEHPFFAPLTFELMENKRCDPVFHPSLEKSNFDAVYELEELLLEQAPLEGRARKAAKKQQQQQQMAARPAEEGTEVRRSKKEYVRKKGKTDEEDHEEEILEMINQYFEPYDYTRY
jgi:serine/threonine kinase 32